MDNYRWITESALPILAQITSDLAECIDSSWAVALAGCGCTLLPVCTFGRNSDLPRCIARSVERLSGRSRNNIDWAGDGADNGVGDGADPCTPRIVSPVRLNDAVVATLVFGVKASGSEYSSRDRDLIDGAVEHLCFILRDERMTAKVGAQLACLQRTKLELASAREVQGRLFPYCLPPVPGLDYYGECLPVGELGGDFFDFSAVDNTSLLLTIGDVSGKGVPAAIVMAGALASLRALGAGHDGRLSDLMSDLNRMIWQISPDNFYATMFHARFDGCRQELQFVNAGHAGVLLLCQGLRQVVRLDSTGTVLGLDRRATYEQRRVPLERGDVLVAVTDGITEAAGPDGGLVDEALILDAVRKHPGASSSDLTGHIIRAAQIFAGGSAPRDDRTVIVVRFNGQSAGALVPEPREPLLIKAFADAA